MNRRYFFAFFERVKYQGGVGREIRPSSVARVSRFSLASRLPSLTRNPTKKSRLFCKLRVYKRKIRLRHSRISQNHIVSLIKLLLITITHIPFDHPWNTVEYPTAFSPSDWLYSLWYAEINSRPEIT